MRRDSRLTVAALVALVVVAAVPAQALPVSHTVGPMDNLYFDGWGHLFVDAIGTGLRARSVKDGGLPFDFAGLSAIDVTVTGCVVDDGPACTGPDGLPSLGLSRDLTVYALIGIWSSTADGAYASDVITAVGSPFFAGSAATLLVPAGPKARYLFLAENDRSFADNTSGQYDVTVNAVPEPSTHLLMGAGLLAFGFQAHRRARGADLARSQLGAKKNGEPGAGFWPIAVGIVSETATSASGSSSMSPFERGADLRP